EGYRSRSGGGGSRGDAPGLGFGVRHHRRQGLPSDTPSPLPESDAPVLLGQQQRLAAWRRLDVRLPHGHPPPRRRHQPPSRSALGQVSPPSPVVLRRPASAGRFFLRVARTLSGPLRGPTNERGEVSSAPSPRKKPKVPCAARDRSARIPSPP